MLLLLLIGIDDCCTKYEYTEETSLREAKSADEQAETAECG
jgi:hypothetical protein